MVKKYGIFYGWVVVGVSFVTLFLSVGIRFSFGVFYIAIIKDLGWGRAETAGAFSLAMVVHALFAIVTGNLVDRFGPRIIFPIGATIFALGLVAASQIVSVWHLYLFFGIIIAAGINAIAYAPHMSRIPKWFKKEIGLASGIVVSGIGIGTMAMAPIIQYMIDRFGWRFAFLYLAVIVFTIVVPLTAIFQRRSAHDIGQPLDGINPKNNKAQRRLKSGDDIDEDNNKLSVKWKLKTIIKTQSFWFLGITYLSMGFFANTLVVHQAAHIIDIGYTASTAAVVVGLVGFFRSTGNVLFGFLSDRIGKEQSFSIGAGLAFVGMLFFIFLNNASIPWKLCLYTVFVGLGHGSMDPIVGAKTADLFPGDSLGKIMGTFTLMYGIGAALGPFLAGFLFDRYGSYNLAFSIILVCIIFGVHGIWLGGKAQKLSHYNR
jgi:MFS family permease